VPELQEIYQKLLDLNDPKNLVIRRRSHQSSSLQCTDDLQVSVSCLSRRSVDLLSIARIDQMAMFAVNAMTLLRTLGSSLFVSTAFAKLASKSKPWWMMAKENR